MRGLLLSVTLMFVTPIVSAATLHLMFDISDDQDAYLVDSDTVVDSTVTVWLRVHTNRRRAQKSAKYGYTMIRNRLTAILNDGRSSALLTWILSLFHRSFLPCTAIGTK